MRFVFQRAVVALMVGVVVGILLLASFLLRSAEPQATPSTTAKLASTPVILPGIARDVDAIASPTSGSPTSGIAAGTCAVITYTPPTASQPFDGDLCVPAEKRHDIGVLLIHGGGGVGGVRGDFAQWRDSYLAAGYVTLSMSYRILDIETDAGIFPQPEANTKAAIQYLRIHADALGLAADHIVAHGASAGARLAGIAFATPDDPLFGSAERWPDVSDELNGMVGYYGYYDGWTFEPQAYFRAGISPIANAVSRAGGARGVALLVHGDADWLIDVSLSRRFADALEQSGVDVTLAVVEGETHSFDGYGEDALSPVGETEFARVDGWLQEHFG